MAEIKPELEKRPSRARLAPPDYENRAMDLAISAIDDIRECDQASMFVKWDKLAGVVVPMLYILFDGSAASLEKIPKVHVHPVTGKYAPAQAICLAKMPSGRPLEGQQIKDHVRRSVEQFLRQHDVRPSFYSALVDLNRLRPPAPKS